MWRSLIASKSPQSLTRKIIASGVYPVSDVYIVHIYDVYLMCIQLHCTVTAQVALCQLCQLDSDYCSNRQGTSDPQRSLSLCKRAMGGEDQSFDCQLKPANNSLTCSYSISHNVIEVENGDCLKVTTIGGTHFSLPWLWEERYFTRMLRSPEAFFENRNMTDWTWENYNFQTQFRLILRSK